MRAKEFISEQPASGFKQPGQIAPTKVKWTQKGGQPNITPTVPTKPGAATAVAQTIGQSVASQDQTKGLSDFKTDVTANKPSPIKDFAAGLKAGFKQSMGISPSQTIGGAAAAKALGSLGMKGTASAVTGMTQLQPGTEIEMPKLGMVKVIKTDGNEVTLDTKALLGTNLRVNTKNIPR